MTPNCRCNIIFIYRSTTFSYNAFCGGWLSSSYPKCSCYYDL